MSAMPTHAADVFLGKLVTLLSIMSDLYHKEREGSWQIPHQYLSHIGRDSLSPPPKKNKKRSQSPLHKKKNQNEKRGGSVLRGGPLQTSGSWEEILIWQQLLIRQFR